MDTPGSTQDLRRGSQLTSRGRCEPFVEQHLLPQKNACRTRSAGLSLGHSTPITPGNTLGSRQHAYLSQQHGVAPFSDDDRCILRVAVIPAGRAVRLSDGTAIAPSDPIADVHCWNERIPSMPKGGANLAWAQQTSTRLRYSLRLLAHAMVNDPRLSPTLACRAKVNFVGQGCSNESVTRIIHRLGYEDVDEGAKTMRVLAHDAFENILISALVWTHNPEALKREKMIRERRPVWSSRAKMLRLYRSTPTC